MRMRFPSSFWIQILYFALSSRTVFVTGAARYEDEFQRSNFYTNEQGVGVDVERNVPDKSLFKKQNAGRVIESNIVKDSRGADNLRPDNPANNEGDSAVVVKAPRQNKKQVIKRSAFSNQASETNPDDTENHFRIPRERVTFIDGLDYQDRVDNDKRSFILSREETRGLRQARKSLSDSSNSNWKWGFKRKQVKNEPGTKDAAVCGSNHNSLKHKDVAVGRNQQSDVMARGGHSTGDILDNENYPSRQSVVQANSKLVEQKHMKYDTHQQVYQRQEVMEEHNRQGVSHPRPDAISRQDLVARADAVIPESLGKSDAFSRPVANTRGSSKDILYSKTGNIHRQDSAPRSYNWDVGNPRIYSAPKFDTRKAAGVIVSPRVETMKADSCSSLDNPQMDNQRAQNIPVEPNKLEGGLPYEDPRIENVPRMDELKNEEVPSLDQRTNDIGPKMEDQGVEILPQVEGMYDNNNVKGNSMSSSQRQENNKHEALRRVDDQQMGSQRIDSAQRIDNPSAVNNGWKDDNLQGVANTQRMKQHQGNLNVNSNMGASARNSAHRLDSAARGGLREEEIRYLVFTPAEFSPMTLRSVLGESEKPLSAGIPYCTLEEYKLESASLREKSFENYQDRQMQYRGKGYNIDMITRRKRKYWEARKKPLIRQPRKPPCESPGVQMPIHNCTASPSKPECPYGLVVQTAPYDPYDRYTTECYIDALTRSTCRLDGFIGIGARITPSIRFEGLRGHIPILSHFDNTVVPSCSTQSTTLPPTPKRPGPCHRGQSPSLPVVPQLRPNPEQTAVPQLRPNPEQTSDVALLADILNHLARSKTVAPPAVKQVKRENPEEIQEQKIIEKYLMSLMEQPPNPSKTQSRIRNNYEGGIWLGKLLQELADNKLKYRIRKNQPAKKEGPPLK